MHRQFLDPSDAEGLALSAALLLVEHVACWPYRGRLPLVSRYVMGTAALCAGQSLAAHRRGASWLRPWAYAAVGGAVVGAAHAVRALAHRRARMAIYENAAGAWPLPD